MNFHYMVSYDENGRGVEKFKASTWNEAISWFEGSYVHHVGKEPIPEDVEKFEDKWHLKRKVGRLVCEWDLICVA